MKRQKPIQVQKFVKVRGTNTYRQRTEAELKEAAQRALARREANEVAKRVLANRELFLGQSTPRLRIKKED